MAATPAPAAHASPSPGVSVSSISDGSDSDSDSQFSCSSLRALSTGATPRFPPSPSFTLTSRSSDVSVWDSQVLCRHAQCLELEELAAISVDPMLLPALNDLLLEVYNMLRPKPLDYEQRNTLVHVFNKMTNKIFGNNNGFPVVEAFGSFTMDLFTPYSDLDLSINFSNSTDEYTRKKRISVLRKFAKVLYSHQRDGIFCGVLPILGARVPILKVIDCGTGIDCDISVENKDGMTRSMIFKFISSLDERFQILSYLAKFWANLHELNSPRELTMSSMSIISLVTFHLQTRHPPILPPFSAFLNDGLDCARVERNIMLLKGFGSRNKESVAQLFVSLISKLLSAQSLWEHGLCASNWEASWISKTWKKGVGNLSVEDFLDRSQNFARSIGKVQMQKICRCLRDCSLYLLDFLRGKINTSKLKTLLFGHLSPDELVIKPRLRHAKGKRKIKLSTKTRHLVPQKRAKHGPHHVEQHSDSNIGAATGLTTHTTAKATPHIPYQRPRQSSNQIVHIPGLRIVPSGFGYGLSVRLPVDPHCGKGILGPAPGNISSLDNGTRQPQRSPLLPTPTSNQQIVGNSWLG